MSSPDVPRDKLQLVGVTAFLVAAKTVEEVVSDPDDCAYWTDNGEECSADSFCTIRSF